MEDPKDVSALIDDSSTFVREELPNSDVVHVFGEFSFATCSDIEEALVRGIRIGRPIVCNLLGCTYLDAAGVGVLARARRSLGSAFRIAAPERGIVRRVLEITEMMEPSFGSDERQG